MDEGFVVALYWNSNQNSQLPAPRQWFYRMALYELQARHSVCWEGPSLIRRP